MPRSLVEENAKKLSREKLNEKDLGPFSLTGKCPWRLGTLICWDTNSISIDNKMAASIKQNKTSSPHPPSKEKRKNAETEL